MKKTGKIFNKILSVEPAPTQTPGSFGISHFFVEPEAMTLENRVRAKVPAGSEIISCLAVDDGKIVVYYKHANPAPMLVDFDVMVLKHGDKVDAPSDSHYYHFLQSIAVGGVVYHLFHHFYKSRLMLN